MKRIIVFLVLLIATTAFAGPPGAPPVGPGTDLVVKSIVANGMSLSSIHSGAANPDADYDINDDVAVGDMYINTTSDAVFTCADNTATAAVWVEVSASAAGATTEEIQDGAWSAIGTETLITVTYQDATNDVDFVVDGDLANYTWTNVDDADIPDTITVGASGSVNVAALPVASGSTAGIVPTTSGVADGWVLTVQADESLAYEASASGVTDFVSLSDTPANFTGSGGYAVMVNSTPDALEFVNIFGTAQTITGNWVNTDNPWADNEVVDALTISGGTVNNSVIGGSTAAAITGTTVKANTSFILEGGANDTTLIAGSPTAAVTYTLPAADGIDGQYLSTNGSGVLSFTDPPGGGDISQVGDAESGAAFTADGTGNVLYFEGATANGFEIALTGANPAGDVVVTIPAATGTLLLADGDGSSLTSVDAATGDSATAFFDAGTIEHEYGGLEADVSAYDGLVKITGGSTSAVTTTAFAESILDDADEATFKATVNLEIGTDVLAQQTIGIANDNLLEVDGTPQNGEAAVFTANGINGLSEAEFKTAFNIEAGTDFEAVDADIARTDTADTIGADWEWQDGIAMSFGNDNDFEVSFDTDISGDDGGDNDFAAGALSGAALKIAGSSASDINILVNNAGTGGSILYVDQVVTNSMSAPTGATGDSYIALSNNSGGLAPSGYRLYFETDGSDVLSYSLDGSEKRVANLEDAQTISGAKTFAYDIIFNESADHQSTPGAGKGYLWVKSDTPSSLIFTDDAGTDYDLTASASGDIESVGDAASGAALDGSSDGGSYIRIYDGDSHYGEFQVPDVSGNVTYTFPATTETIASLEGSDTQVIFNNGGTTYAGDAGFVFNSTTDTLTLGEDGVDGKLVLFNDGGTDYNLILQPGTQSSAATITFPGSTGTLATLGNAETFSGIKTFSARPVFSAGITIADAGNIGSASDLDAIAIAANGVVTFSQIPVLPTNSIDEADLSSTNAPTDNYVLSYNEAGTNFTWVEMSAGGSDDQTLAEVLTEGADANDLDITSVDKLEGVDAQVYVDLGADGVVEIQSDTTVQIGASDENLRITDGGANQINIGSGSGVDTISFGAINLIATGHIDAGTRLIETTTDVNVTVDGSSGIYINNHASTINYTLPADPETAGGDSKVFVFRNRQANAITITPAAGDVIELDGADETAAETIVSTGAIGEMATLVGFDDGGTDRWIVFSTNGTWDGGTD